MIYRRTSQAERDQGLGETTRTHIGAVVASGSEYLGDGDSTYWAVVSDGQGGFERIAYCSTYCICFSTGDRCRTQLDPSPELAEAYTEYRERGTESSTVMQNAMSADLTWHRPGRGAIVRVVRGRKVPLGLEGMVQWTGSSKFGDRIGILPSAGGEMTFIAASNVEVVFQPDLGIDPCGERIEQIPAASIAAGSTIVETGLTLSFEGRPDFREVRVGGFVTGGDPRRYWGYVVIPVRALGHQALLALHFSGQSDWSVVRLTATTYNPVHPQQLLEWLLRPANAPTAEYRPGPIPPFIDPRTGAGAKRIVDGVWALAAAGNPKGGISLSIT